MDLLIKNVRLNGNNDGLYDLHINNGIIQKITESGESHGEYKKTIDGDGCFAFGGLVDMHCHLREPGFEHKEDILSGSMAAAKGGFTAVACMPNTNPPADSEAVIRYIKEKALKADFANVYPIASITKSQRGAELAEYGALKNAGAVALSDDGLPVENPLVMRNALLYAKSHDMLIISHCEDKQLVNGGCVNESFNGIMSGLRCSSPAAEEIMAARDIILAGHTNSRVHIAHISTKGSVNLIKEAKERGIKVTCETCPHYFAADDSLILGYDTSAKVNPPLRSQEDRQAIIQGIKDGVIDAIATDHAPHHIDDKNVEFEYAASGISGFETAFALSYTYLVKAGHITLEKLVELMGAAPAKILGIPVPEIKEGAPADLFIADLGNEYLIDVSKFVSKGRNSPFNGYKVYGKILHTIYNGKIKVLGGEIYDGK
jgi:dihydroorotase